MAAKGATAKIDVENKIRNAFGADFIGVYDKKIYVWADDGGERVQVAISMTCPKVPVGTDDADFGTDTNLNPPEVFKPAEITSEETENIKKLLAEFGL